MELRKTPFIVLISFLISFYAYSQNKDKEIGVLLGITQYYGDLSATKVFDPSSAGGGILFRNSFNPRLGIRANLFYGQVSGADYAKPRSSEYAWTRNLSFKSHVLDISVMLELNIRPFISGKKKKSWTPYVVAGIGIFNFDPKAEYMGNWYRLQPLGLEGQGTKFGGPKYNLTEITLPYGAGIKYGFKRPRYGSSLNLELWNIGFEVISHKTFTDHLDDVGGYYPETLEIFGDNQIARALCDRSGEVGQKSRIRPNSKRGNPDKMDGYFWFCFTITKTIRPYRCFGF